jgi:hypothetical protein
MSVLGAVVAGLIGTAVMSVAIVSAPRMGLPQMDFAGMLANLVGLPRLRALGWVLHALVGVGWAFVYAALWSAGVGSPDVTVGLAYGIGHWLIAGALVGLFSYVRPGPPGPYLPGFYFRNLGGSNGFFGGLMVHAIYGLTVGLVYQFFRP